MVKIGRASAGAPRSAVGGTACPVCPICFDPLHTRPHQVGALTCEGRRIERTLYHQSCIRTDSGSFRFAGGLSPTTRLPVDGFQLVPPFSKSHEWTVFVDWNGDGRLAVQEVASVIAALVPVDEPRAERFVLSRMTSSGDGFVDMSELPRLLPHLQRHMRRLVADASLPPSAPQICRTSTDVEMRQWFQHWDPDGTCCLDRCKLKLALASCFRSYLIDADAATADSIAEACLEGTDSNVATHWSEDKFVRHVAPQLRANLPASLGSTAVGEVPFDPKGLLRLRIQWMKTGALKTVDLASDATVRDLRHAASKQCFRTQFADREVQLFFRGQALRDDRAVLCEINGLWGGATVQVLPGSYLSSMRHPARPCLMGTDMWGRPLGPQAAREVESDSSSSDGSVTEDGGFSHEEGSEEEGSPNASAEEAEPCAVGKRATISI